MGFPLSTTSSAAYTYVPTILKIVENRIGALSSLPEILDKLNIRTPLIITGNSLQTKTDVIKQITAQVEGSGRKVAGVHSKIGEHAPIAGIHQGMDMLKQYQGGDGEVGLIACGGGSPIDAAKTMIHLYEKEFGKILKLVSIPTTLSAAEMTIMSGYTTEDRKKTGVKGSNYTSSAIIYDANLSLSTPNSLWVSTGVRALDHAAEQQIRPNAPLPVRVLAREAFATLFEALKACAKDEKDVEARQRAFAGASMSLWSDDQIGSLGLSHALGYLLGSPYSMPHGYCSCITLGLTMSSLAKSLKGDNLKSLASLYPLIEPSSSSLSDEEKVDKLGQAIDDLVTEMQVNKRLSDYKVPESDLDGIVEKGCKAVGRDDDERLKKDLLERLKAKM